MKTNSFLYFLPCVDGRVIRCAAFVGIVIIAGVGSLSFAANTDGTIDPSFGVNGRTVTDFKALPNGSRSEDWARAVILQSDGKIVAAGSTISPNGDYNFALVRYNSNGIIDPTFGVNGRSVTDFKALPNGSRSNDYANAVILQPDGKIVAAGGTNSPNANVNFAVVRYLNRP